MTDSALVERCKDSNSTALIDVGLLCNMSSQELVEEHRSSYKLTTLHQTLLGLNREHSSLRGHLLFLQRLGLLAELIDKPDSRGRSALAWAVEYGMPDAVQTLLSFGADARQHRRSPQSELPLLHLVSAGPPPLLASGFFAVVKILLATDININARDNEGWSAWHVAASWRSYDILREIIFTHGACVELEVKTDDGALAHDLSQDKDFYQKLMPTWSEC
jgi:ankyrin repeat protein